MSESVSVIIPVYNGAKYLAEAVDSALAQTVPPDEIVIVDDGSTDSTPAVIASYGARVRTVRQDNRGGAAAMNRGVAAATGTLIAFLDSDDLWEPTKTAIQLQALAEDPSLEAVFGLVRQFVSLELDAETAGRFVYSDAPLRGVSKVTMMIRRDSFLRVGPYNEALRAADFVDWYPRALDVGLRSRIVPTVMTRRRLHGANNGVRQRALQRANNLDALKAALDRRRGRA
jgi:glycosyltransferase involved in cell wall biosynthesis